MQTTLESISPTLVKLTVTGDEHELGLAKKQAVENLGRNVRLAGFRTGTAPQALVEKQLDPNALAEETLNLAVNALYSSALTKEKLRAVKNPEVNITAFVPYTQVTFTASVEVIGPVKLGKYKGLKATKEPAKVSAKDVYDVLDRLKNQLATKDEVNRPAKGGDEVVIDFKGVDAKTGEPISGADGQDYPLVLGSKSFIPGFEDKLIGAQTDSETTFDIVFPEDYGVKDLQKKKVTFRVSVKSIHERKLPALDDAMAKLVGPFNSLKELKADIKKELSQTAEREAEVKLQNELVEQVVKASQVDIPDVLVNEEAERLEREERQNAAYSGLTWSEYLKRNNLTDETFKTLSKDQAEARIKTGLVLGEIASLENVSLSKAELDAKLTELRTMYASDPAMQGELDKPENQEDIKNRLMVEKTVNLLVSLNSQQK